MSSLSAKVFVKQGSLAGQPNSASLTRRSFPKSRGVCCAWGSEGRLLKEIQQVGQDVRDIRTEVREIHTEVRDLRTEVRVLDARVNSAVIINVGALSTWVPTWRPFWASLL